MDEANLSGTGSAATDYERLDGRTRTGTGRRSITHGPSGVHLPPKVTVERMVRETMLAPMVILKEQGRPLSELITVLSPVLWALNTAVRQRFWTSRFHVVLVCEPRTSFPAFVEERDELELTELNERETTEASTRHHQRPGTAHKEAVTRHEACGEREREHQRREELPPFTVGDSVLMARVGKTGKRANLVSEWTGP